MEKQKLYPIGKAAEICKVSPRALRYYEEKGLIRRNADRENRRNVLVELTPEGLEMARESFLAQTDMEKRLLTMLSPEEKEQLRTLLKRILLDLKERGEG